MSKVSIIILNWNGWEDTIIECLECIKNGMYNIKQSKVGREYLNMKCINIYIHVASTNSKGE